MVVLCLTIQGANKMGYLTRKELEQALLHPKKLSPEKKAKMEEVIRKLKATTYEERRAFRMKEAEKRGYM